MKKFAKLANFILFLALPFITALSGPGAASAQKELWLEQATRFDDLIYQGKYLEAHEAAKRVLEVAKKTFPADSKELAASLAGVALGYLRSQQYNEAEIYFSSMREILGKAIGKWHPDYAISLEGLALVYGKTGRYSAAEKLFKEVQEIKEANLGMQHPDVAVNLYNLGVASLFQEKYNEAEGYLRRALAIQEESSVEGHSELAQTLRGLTYIYRQVGQLDNAREFAERLDNLDLSNKGAAQSSTLSIPEPQRATEEP